MAFLTNSSQFLSFAEYSDVLNTDQRLFETNEGLTDDVVEDALIRSSERILTLLRNTPWWKNYYLRRNDNQIVINTSADIPAVDPDLILDRQSDFTDLCVYYSFYYYLLPKIADFSQEDNAERAKIGYYQQKFDLLFGELVTAGDWYDFDAGGTITSDEKSPGQVNLKRIR